MSFFSWYHLTQMHLVLDALDSQRSLEEPNFTKRVIQGYLETKIKRGMPTQRVDEKLTALERALVQRRLLDFTKQIVEIRTVLQLPPSQVFPLQRSRRSSRNPTTNVLRPPTYSIVDSAPSYQLTRPPPHPYLYLPLCTFKNEEDLPVYSPFESNPVRRRAMLEMESLV
ncbi:hypothetical protein BDY24DRAFT_414580 [Mrakia frigida]|uniref:uncharacterized protein n=1 Tax=Mrakia frigida TaxID=29902 RepID=UPI003FCC04DA